MSDPRPLTRRQTLGLVAAVAAAGTGIAGAAGGRVRTPPQGEGPYYPIDPPAAAGNDLVHGPGGATAAGRPLALAGRVWSTGGAPIGGATVEIWQCDNQGIYPHPRAPGHARVDPAFAGFGRARTGAGGGYSFLTIVPVPYTGRPPHIHAKVFVDGREVLTTQLYLKGHPKNARDGLFGGAFSGKRDLLLIEPRPATLDGGVAGHAAAFDFVV